MHHVERQQKCDTPTHTHTLSTHILHVRTMCYLCTSTSFFIHTFSRCAIFNMIKRKNKKQTKMTGTCKFTAAACGADGADRPRQTGAPREERCSIMREDCHQTSAQNRKKNTTSTWITLQKREQAVPLLSIIHLLGSSLYPSPPLFFQLLYKLTSSCATNCLSLSRYCP